MKNEIPKPFLEIEGKTILEYTLSRFTGYDELCKVIIATSEDYFETVADLKKIIPDGVQFKVVEGGSERQYSIHKALQHVDGGDLVVIHDAVRPFVTQEEIGRCLTAAQEAGAAIVGMPLRDTLKMVGNDGRILSTPDREQFWRAQTPQIFGTDVIREAYENADSLNLSGTDDASLVEAIGRKVVIVEGSIENFKVTYPIDLEIAKVFLNR